MAHRLGPKKNTQGLDKSSIVVKLCRRDTKLDLMKACKTVKPKNIYINESWTTASYIQSLGLERNVNKDGRRGCHNKQSESVGSEMMRAHCVKIIRFHQYCK